MVTIDRVNSLCLIIEIGTGVCEGSVTIDRVFIWCDYRQGSTV